MKSYVKKLMAPSIVITMVFSLLLVACGNSGPPVPPVSKMVDLDKLVANNMTVDQVNALLKPELKSTATLYQATTAQQSADGSWVVTTKKGGFKTGETGPYQVLYFTPSKAGDKYYAVFFKANVVFGKSWFDLSGGAFIEKLLQGQGIY
jgi:hypothetical protein